MPADLPNGELIILEMLGHLRPFVEEAPDPGQADQADPDLDPARPVHAGEERVLLHPGAQLVRHLAVRA